LHLKYILSLQRDKKDLFESWSKAHIKMSGIYWGLQALDTMNTLHLLDKELILRFVMECYNSNDGGFGGNRDYDSHVLYTLSAVQVLIMLDALDRIDLDKTAQYVGSLQHEDGSFAGDVWGEIDTRFCYCAVSCLSLISRLSFMNVNKAVEYLLNCQNFDASFGVSPGAESHGAQTFCSICALHILNATHLVDKDKLGWWLAERQMKEGGLNGRPEKLPDVCYSWWNLSSLASIDRLHWIDKEKCYRWILECQDGDDGGISDRPGNMCDVYHTCFGITGLSLLGYEGMAEVDSRYCMTKRVIQKLNIQDPPPITYTRN